MPQPQENARVLLFVILIFWLITSPNEGGGPTLYGIHSVTHRLERQRRAHGVLNSTKWGDFSPRLKDDQKDYTPHYLNLTGFRQEDGFAWEDLGRFKDRCQEWSRNARSSLPALSGKDLWDVGGAAEPTWQNVTGVVTGEWVRRPGSVERHAMDYNLTEMAPEVDWLAARHEWNHNVTGQHGKIILNLDDEDHWTEFEDGDKKEGGKSDGLIREISAEVTMQDEASSSSQWSMRFHGVHWPRQGIILLSSTSEKFAGIFGLPHLAPGPKFFRSSQQLLNTTLDEVLRRKERTRFSDPSNPWASSLDQQGDGLNPAPHCEYVLYAQVHPLSPQQLGIKDLDAKAQETLGSLVDDIEKELRNPTGAPVPGYPELQVSTVMWSPDCSYFLESKGPPIYPSVEGRHLVGKKDEILAYGGKIWLMFFAAVFFGQVYLLKAQMRESSTPSTVGRVSFYTASIMLQADGLIFAAASAWSLSASTTLLPSLLVTLGAFMSMALGGVFVGDVYKVQEPERRNRQREQAAANPTPTPAAAAPTPTPALPTDSLPLPVTASRPASTPIIIPSDQDIDAEIAENAAAGAAAVPTPGTTRTPGTQTPQARATTFSSVSGRFILVGIFILFLSLAAISWPAAYRSAYVNLITFLYFSLWWPQIWRNVQRNSRRAYSWRFMIGQSVLRACPFAYFYCRDDNILFARPDRSAFALLVGWLWIQLWILAGQDVLGPRYVVPKGWAPEAWDYHPVLREDNLESGGLPIGLVSGDQVDEEGRSLSTRKERDRDRGKDRSSGFPAGVHVHSIDCAICRETLEVPVVPAGSDPDAVGAGGSVAATLARRTYMVTPCRHLFHSDCLEGWLRFRLQCPICREELPPL
jgi:hypothetical protein